MKILHLPDVVGGHSVALAKGERALGAEAESLGYRDSPYGYRADRALRWGAGPAYRRWAERIGAFLDVRGRYDVFHFNFGASLLHAPGYGLILPELAHYGAQAKRFMTFQGSESRLAYPPVLAASREAEIAKGRIAAGNMFFNYPSEKLLTRRRRTVARAIALTDHVFVLNPDLLDNLPADRASYLPYAIALPDGMAQPANEATRDNRPAHFVHLSTNTLLKGTALIERALEQAARRCELTYDIVIKQPRPDALRRLAQADYHIDQMVLGWYGGTAVEAMLMGIPVICHIDERCLTRVQPEMAADLPIVRASSDTLAERIVELARDRNRRAELSRRAREFAGRWHDPRAVAAITLRRYAG